jgi:Leucine-rich repeat (LRR) protein
LEVLNLSYNKLTFESIRSLYICQSLKILDLASNSLEQLPPDLYELAQLEELNLASNLLTSVSTL